MLLRGSGEETEVLLQLRGPGASYMVGRWACGAAGHVELGESVAAAAAREAREELGIELDLHAVTPLTTLQRNGFHIERTDESGDLAVLGHGAELRVARRGR